MAGRIRPGPMRQIWLNFKASLRKTKEPRVQIGEDYLGNRYFEQRSLSAETGQHNRRTLIRSFESVRDDWERLPPEWEAWLRLKREDAPSPEEIEANIQMMLQKQRNAKLLEEKRLAELEDGDDPQLSLPSDPKAHRPFPIYPGYSDGSRDPSGSSEAPIRDHTVR